MREWLTIQQAAEILGTSRQSLRNWQLRGLITSVRHPFNNRRVYMKTEIERVYKEINKKDLEWKNLPDTIKRFLGI